MEEPERSTTPDIPTILALDENDQEAVIEVDVVDREHELEDDVDSETLRTRVCYVAQVLAFLVALIGLIVGLTIGYNKPEESSLTNELDSAKWACPYDNLIGDGFCDDETNDFACDFDGGDCCGPSISRMNCIQCQCLITTISTTTYSTTTVITTESYVDPCPYCPKNDTMIVPARIDQPPIKIRSGNYLDCKEICRNLFMKDCVFFNFYTSEFNGPENLKNLCFIFLATAVTRDINEFGVLERPKTLHIKGVIGGRGEDEILSPVGLEPLNNPFDG